MAPTSCLSWPCLSVGKDRRGQTWCCPHRSPSLMESDQETHSPPPICSSAQGVALSNPTSAMSLPSGSPLGTRPRKGSSFCLPAGHRPPPSPGFLALPSLVSGRPHTARGQSPTPVAFHVSDARGLWGQAEAGAQRPVLTCQSRANRGAFLLPVPFPAASVTGPWPQAQCLPCQVLGLGRQGTGRLEAIFILSPWLKTPASVVPHLDE